VRFLDAAGGRRRLPGGLGGEGLARSLASGGLCAVCLVLAISNDDLDNRAREEEDSYTVFFLRSPSPGKVPSARAAGLGLASQTRAELGRRLPVGGMYPRISCRTKQCYKQPR
jgi:hypothetical protein